MSSLHTTKIGLAALTIIFLLLYGYFSTLGKPNNLTFNPANQGFADTKIALGNLGGFHILKNIDYSDEKQFHRLIIETELNRATASPEDISIPYTVIQETSSLASGAALPEEPKALEMGSVYQIKIKLSDTTVENIPLNQALAIFPGTSSESDQSSVIKEVQVSETSDEAAEISISLTKKVQFRAAADNSGAIILDILK